MKILLVYIKQKAMTVVFLLLSCLIFGASFFFYRLPVGALWYPSLLCCGLLVILGLADFLRFRKRHRFLVSLQETGSMLREELPEPQTCLEADYLHLIHRLMEDMRSKEAADKARCLDMVDYYTVWAHQIKTPIAAMHLTLENQDTPQARQLRSGLLRIEQYVQMVLAFLRLDSPQTDYVFARCPLDAVIRRAVRAFAPEFIARKIRLSYTPTDKTVVTDEKWLGFVLEQVVSNALKYTPRGTVKIYVSGDVLCVEDTGIGIAPEDLPRIFEKGYTGCNGRMDMKASGLGLYLCRRICDNLGIAISAESQVGVGSVIRLDMAQYSAMLS